MPTLTYGNLLNVRRPGLRGLGDTLYVYKSAKTGETATGTEAQIASFVENSKDTTWEYKSTKTGTAPKAVIVEAGVMSKILDWGKSNKDTLIGLVKPAKTPKVVMPAGAPAAGGISNTVIIVGVAAVLGLGIFMFMRK